MAVKVIEYVGSSPYNWTDAVNSAVREASKTIDDMTAVKISNFTANVNEGNVTEYKANIQISFQMH
jgi:flavin-binding protein dodecin